MKKVVAIAALCVLILSGQVQAKSTVFKPNMPERSTLIKGYCPKVIDGDTVYIELTEDGVSVAHIFRLIGVDTPETVHPETGLQPYGNEASAFTENALLGKWVYIEYDMEKKDAYDRHLAYIWLEDGTLFNLTLLQFGYGKFMAFAPNIKYSTYLIYAQKAARETGIGVWAPLPEAVMAVDLSGMSVKELMLLRERISEELARRAE